MQPYIDLYMNSNFYLFLRFCSRFLGVVAMFLGFGAKFLEFGAKFLEFDTSLTSINRNFAAVFHASPYGHQTKKTFD